MLHLDMLINSIRFDKRGINLHSVGGFGNTREVQAYLWRYASPMAHSFKAWEQKDVYNSAHQM
jgi:hypothetical protein